VGGGFEGNDLLKGEGEVAADLGACLQCLGIVGVFAHPDDLLQGTEVGRDLRDGRAEGDDAFGAEKRQ